MSSTSTFSSSIFLSRSTFWSIFLFRYTFCSIFLTPWHHTCCTICSRFLPLSAPPPFIFFPRKLSLHHFLLLHRHLWGTYFLLYFLDLYPETFLPLYLSPLSVLHVHLVRGFSLVFGSVCLYLLMYYEIRPSVRLFLLYSRPLSLFLLPLLSSFDLSPPEL